MSERIKTIRRFGFGYFSVTRRMETREPYLILFHKYITDMIKQFNEINFNHVPREVNQMADALATLAAMFQVNSSDEVQPIKMRLNETPTHYAQIEDEVDGKPWYYDIRHYIER